jgi:hypothetical protein
MLCSIHSALRQIREDLAAALAPATIREACRAAGHRWRERVLDPVTTVHLFVPQILHRNTACAHLPRLTGGTFSPSAYCRARSRLPLAVCQALLRRVTAAVQPLTDEIGRWRGHRTWLVGGTGVSRPDTPDLAGAFGYAVNQRAGCGFPVAKVVALFHAGTGLLRHLLPGPLRSHEMARVTQLHPVMRAGDVLVGDRAFGSFAHLALLGRQGLHGVFRLNGQRVIDFTPHRAAPPRSARKALWGKARSRWVRSLGPTDQVVEWYKPYVRPTWLTVEGYAGLPMFLPVRECRSGVDRPGFRVREVTLVTSLPDAEAYPLTALADLYRARWRVETDLRHLEVTLGMDVLRCATADGVREEVAMYARVYNLVRVVMLEAGRRQGVPADRISFADALRWLSSSPPGTPLGERVVNPDRPDRVEPRCQKRRGKNYPFMIRPRHNMRRYLLDQQPAA